MFAIHSPQTVELKTDDETVEPVARINFSYNGADTSRCKMEVISKDRIWTLIFNQRGYIVDQSFTDGDGVDKDAPILTDADYIVDGVDTRSFNPYTHKAPVDADTAYRDGLTPGWKAPESKEMREAGKQARSEAAANAKKAVDELRARRDETPEQRAERERKEQDDRLQRAVDSMEKAPDSQQAVTQAGEPRRNPDGSVVTPHQDRPDARDNPATPPYDPLVPAASSPMPNSAQPRRQSEPLPGAVNTTQTMQGGRPALDERP